MFPWSIARSAEAMFSRWALKRLFKFLLKKKLGQFILGEIDLDQLDVQLGHGTIQLCDLALNVDYINSKLGAVASLMVKEGSIGSLLVKMPWSGKGCQIEADGLELVISPCIQNHATIGNQGSGLGENDNQHFHQGLTRIEHDMAAEASNSTPMDVHEGVKTIAKMIKLLLTSFHFKISNLIVAFDPSLGQKVEKTESLKTMVFRMSEIACGTCISEDSDSSSDVLGISQLINFVKFKGTILELLQMDNVNNQEWDTNVNVSSEPSLLGCQKRATTPIMTGNEGGFCGNLKLSIPWKNGILDICKVDADVSIDPVVFRFQPSTIEWILCSCETYKQLYKDGSNSMNQKPTEFICPNSMPSGNSSSADCVVNTTEHAISSSGASPVDFSSMTQPESVAEASLPGAHLISDWVPFSVAKHKKDSIQELDFGASVDQFFSCFDGIRSTQSALGSSGMWNWTCSVFSVITAASSLASGSLHIPSEQRHVETDLRATIAGFSVVFSFQDEEKYCCNPGTEATIATNYQYLAAECRDIVLVLQVCPRATTVEGTVKYMELANFIIDERNAMNCTLKGCNNHIQNRMILIQRIQAQVHGVLPSSAFYAAESGSDILTGLVATDLPLGNKKDLVKVVLFNTSRVTHGKASIELCSDDGRLTGPTSFSLDLPPFMFWVNFPVIIKTLDFLTEVGKSVEMKSKTNGSPSETSDKKHESSSHVKIEKGFNPSVATISSTEHLYGKIVIPNARVILCFPFKENEDWRNSLLWEQFIAFDFTSSSQRYKEGTGCSGPAVNASTKKKYPLAAVQSLHLNAGNLHMYLIKTSISDRTQFSHCNLDGWNFSAQHVLSTGNRTSNYFVVTMLWQKGQVTGPWIAKKAKLLATLDESRDRDDFVGRGYEFASVSTVRDLEDLKSQSRQEMILSSTFFMHFNFSHVTVSLNNSQYIALHCLLSEMLDALSSITCIDCVKGESFVSQTSVLLESNYVEISISLDAEESIRSSLQSELPGMWHCLKLRIKKLELLSITNTGGIAGADLFWLAHAEGKLGGFISGAPKEEFLLISCSNSTMKRGDGGGSNALSSRLAGSDIILLSDPQSFHKFTSITVSCSTIIAAGGRLDWFDAIPHFFSLPSPDIERARDDGESKRDQDAASSTFILSLVDVGLSYEPYVNNVIDHNEVSDFRTGSSHVKEEIGEQFVACLLAASSFTLSNSNMGNLKNNENKIRVQDLGLLLHIVPLSKNLSGTYSSEHLHKNGYIKVAQEALIEANLRTACEGDLLWELEVSKSHIYVETCHDTTSSLIRLAAQLQQLFAPDIEESIVHLQTRWDNVQQAQRNEFNDKSNSMTCDTVASTILECSSNLGMKDELGVVGLMNEICEDAFHVNNNKTCQSSGSGNCVALDRSFNGEVCSISIDEHELLFHDIPLNGLVPGIEFESSQTSFLPDGCFPEIMEGYCLSDLHPASELHAGTEIIGYKTISEGKPHIVRESSGWYGESSLDIVENHIPEVSDHGGSNFAGSMLASCDSSRQDDIGKACGRVLLNNIDIRWRMFGGSDWPNSSESGEHSANICGKDVTRCLELALSGLKFQYDMFPVGGVCVSKISLSVQDFHFYDRSRDAPWKLVLGYYHSKEHPRKSSSKAFKLVLEAVRPDPLIPLEEYRLRVALLPMLLHLHQCQLDFLIEFFGAKGLSDDQSPNCHQDLDGSDLSLDKSQNIPGHSIDREALLPFFQKFDIWPIVVRVDYIPHHLDLAALRRGNYVELVNFFPWKGVELQLKHVHAVGIYGWSSVCETILGEWLEDISQNQIHKILRGLPTVQSLIAVSTGAAKLVSSPVESYKKEHRVLKGMQRGAIAFLQSISLEAVALGVHLAAGAHDILLQAEYILASVPSVPLPVQDKSMTDVRSNQPKDAHQGIQQAYESLRDGLGKTAAVLVQNPLKKYQRGSGAGSALAAVVRAVPAAALAPASACASAAHCALLGFRNSLDPERKKESMEKYCPTQPWEQE